MLQSAIDFYYRYKKKWGWFGRYSSWAEAQAMSSGYDSDAIFEKVRHATQAVKDGKAAFERDSVVFYHTEINQNLIQSLEKVLTTEGVLRVLDFGGALGSTYFQHQTSWDTLPVAVWSVVEQKRFIEIGKQVFENPVLKFDYTIDESIQKYQPNVVILSSVLQYFEQPYNLLMQIIDTQIPYVVIDRTPFIDEATDRLTVQIVSPSVYEASYPCWMFSASKFSQFIESYFTIETEADALDKSNVLNCRYRFLFLNRKLKE